MNNRIRHLGVVDNVDSGCIKVRIVQTSACSSCKMSANCNASESKEKIVDIYDDNSRGLKVGDNIIVTASLSTGFWAVVLSSVIPLALLIVVLAAVFFITKNEIYAALFSLGSLLPYYILLYCVRDKIQKRLSFHIDSMSDVADDLNNLL